MRALTAARRSGRVVATLALVLVLAGCVKLDVDLEVASYATVTGTVVIAGAEKPLQAIGQDPDTTSGAGSNSGWLILVAILGGLAVVTVGLALFLTRRRELSRPVPLTPLPSDAEPPPPFGSLNRPDQPLPRPLPPPEPPK